MFFPSFLGSRFGKQAAQEVFQSQHRNSPILKSSPRAADQTTPLVRAVSGYSVPLLVHDTRRRLPLIGASRLACTSFVLCLEQALKACLLDGVRGVIGIFRPKRPRLQEGVQHVKTDFCNQRARLKVFLGLPEFNDDITRTG